MLFGLIQSTFRSSFETGETPLHNFRFAIFTFGSGQHSESGFALFSSALPLPLARHCLYITYIQYHPTRDPADAIFSLSENLNSTGSDRNSTSSAEIMRIGSDLED